ncbi:hypothetical protein [Xylanimonas ulmi]|uniref:Uncharacterized protein n=1 Tax=Xylanimonas ulmi TaxID=228973 RepID=A0A4Q7M7L9_9MICO|nr:hypothetical protein [Xylanibacterium ulmi]RZS62658.1 hypothetical protein EV386_3002 [Xylanibacterium ulmi]
MPVPHRHSFRTHEELLEAAAGLGQREVDEVALAAFEAVHALEGCSCTISDDAARFGYISEVAVSQAAVRAGVRETILGDLCRAALDTVDVLDVIEGMGHVDIRDVVYPAVATAAIEHARSDIEDRMSQFEDLVSDISYTEVSVAEVAQVRGQLHDAVDCALEIELGVIELAAAQARVGTYRTRHLR